MTKQFDCTDALDLVEMLSARIDITTQSLDHVLLVSREISSVLRTLEDFHVVNLFLILFNVISLIFFLAAALKLIERVA